MVIILKSYLVFVVFIMLLYTARHLLFTLNRLIGKQRIYYQDIVDSELPNISVLIPMHNEEKVAANILDLLIAADFPVSKLEIIPINDHSTDKTAELLDGYASRYSYIRPMHRSEGRRGKPAALNDALKLASGEVVIIFDADYLPPKGILRDIAISFKDPEVGAVMGRVIPENTRKNLLTRLIDLERSGGYQVDQQARYNLGLIPQYGGTVGGFRREVVLSLGGFEPNILAEDTELTFKLLINGWKVVYANRVECYEEVPEEWNVRARQIRRWARGHSQVMFRYLLPLLRTPHLSSTEKIDGLLLLFIYTVPFILLTGIIDSLSLFFLGEMQIIQSIIIFLFIAAYNTFGNFAPFYQIGTASLLDGATDRIRLLPLLLFNFLFNMWYVSLGFLDSAIDMVTRRKTSWHKTVRFREVSKGQ
ncbi:MAG: glycosyltransferase family 2 protein [Thermodesulfovibrionales bacterium]